MTVSVVIDLSPVAAVGARLDLVQTEIEQGIRQIMADQMDDAEIRARNSVKVDTGEDRNKIRGSVAVIPGGAVGRLGRGARHGYVRELGRRAGQPMPPKGSLLPWMRRRGIPERAEYPIRRKIKVRGIPADHKLEETINDTLPIVERELNDLGPRVIRRAIRNAGRS